MTPGAAAWERLYAHLNARDNGGNELFAEIAAEHRPLIEAAIRAELPDPEPDSGAGLDDRWSDLEALAEHATTRPWKRTPERRSFAINGAGFYVYTTDSAEADYIVALVNAAPDLIREARRGAALTVEVTTTQEPSTRTTVT